jgi:uncharacterized protein
VPENEGGSLTTSQSNHENQVEAPVNVAYFLVVWVAAAFAQSTVLLVLGPRRGDPTVWVLALSLVAGWSVFLVGTRVASRQVGSGDVRPDFGIRAAPIDLIGVPIGVATQLALVPAVYLPLRAIWPDAFSDAALSETAKDLVDRARTSSSLVLVVLFVVVVIGAPLVEEIVYRGLLQRPLLARYNPAIVVITVAVTFALIHFRPVEYPGLLAAGLVFGICAWRTGRLGMSIAAHVGFNAIGMALAL